MTTTTKRKRQKPGPKPKPELARKQNTFRLLPRVLAYLRTRPSQAAEIEQLVMASQGYHEWAKENGEDVT